MEYNELILVSEQIDMIEKNFVMTIDDLKSHIPVKHFESQAEIDCYYNNVTGNGPTDTPMWSTVYYSDHHWITAKQCLDESELKNFIAGSPGNMDFPSVFIGKLCSKDCVDLLEKYIPRIKESFKESVENKENKITRNTDKTPHKKHTQDKER